MGRSRSSARQAGARFERETADYLAATVDDRIDRRVKTGSADKGDIGGVRTTGGYRVAVECKDEAKMDLSGWVREAEAERVNDKAVAGVVVHKRRGVGHPGQQYVTMTLDNLVVLLGGQPDPAYVKRPNLGQEEES